MLDLHILLLPCSLARWLITLHGNDMLKLSQEPSFSYPITDTTSSHFYWPDHARWLSQDLITSNILTVVLNLWPVSLVKSIKTDIRNQYRIVDKWQFSSVEGVSAPVPLIGVVLKCLFFDEWHFFSWTWCQTRNFCLEVKSSFSRVVDKT